MQYVRGGVAGLAGAVSRTYNSINPANLSGAIDVIVVEQEDGSLACSPFHVRFGKFQLLRPSEKKVEFRVNGEKVELAMKLGEDGDAFFVFETRNQVPASMQTSPLVSPAHSPSALSSGPASPARFDEPTFLDLENGTGRVTTPEPVQNGLQSLRHQSSNLSERGMYGGFSSESNGTSASASTAIQRASSDQDLTRLAQVSLNEIGESIRRASFLPLEPDPNRTSQKAASSPPELRPRDARERAIRLSKKLSTSDIRSRVTESGDLVLDMTGYKSSEDEALRAEALFRKLLTEDMEGDYDIGALVAPDEDGNIVFYSSEEAKDQATRKLFEKSLSSSFATTNESDPGYHSDSDRSSSPQMKLHQRAQSEELPYVRKSFESSHFAKTLRLTSDQLKSLNLKSGPNPISFRVNKSECPAFMYLWRHDNPVVISDIDGTITKSDVMGHLLTMVGRDWTHGGVAKLYTDIAANGYNIFYLTSRSVGQADTTRAYLDGVIQDGYKLPKGPVIMSPDRTFTALKREVYLRKPELFKMACLRDIKSLFPSRVHPFYAGFGNRITDAISYRTVSVPSTRIFTINSKAEVALDLTTMHSYKNNYTGMRQLVDQSFPPISSLVTDGGEDFTDYKFWREDPGIDVDAFVPSDSEDEADSASANNNYGSRTSTLYQQDTGLEESIIRESIELDPDTDLSQLRIVDSLADKSEISLNEDIRDSKKLNRPPVGGLRRNTGSRRATPV